MEVDAIKKASFYGSFCEILIFINPIRVRVLYEYD